MNSNKPFEEIKDEVLIGELFNQNPMKEFVYKGEVYKDFLLPGEEAIFEYTFPGSANFPELHKRTGQSVKILGISPKDIILMNTFQQRRELGILFTYQIEFQDGYIGAAFEDELKTLNEGISENQASQIGISIEVI